MNATETSETVRTLELNWSREPAIREAYRQAVLASTAELFTALAESTCAATNTRRDGIVWSHTSKVRAGKKCPVVIELTSCSAVKAWAGLLAQTLTDLGHRVVVGKIQKLYIGGGYGCSDRPNGFSCWISVLN